MDLRQANMDALARYRPILYEKIKTYTPTPVGDFVETPSGTQNLLLDGVEGKKIPAYGMEDPWQDAAVHLETVEEKSRGLALFVGMGLGYGPLVIYRQRPEISQLAILEPSLDLFCAALRVVDLTELIRDPGVVILAGDIDLDIFEQAVARAATLEDTHILRYLPGFQWRKQLYSSLNDQVFMVINKLNATGGTTRKVGPDFFHNRLDNLSLLRHLHGLEPLENLFAGKPAVLVAAGPSLDQSLAELKKIVGRCILFAVDSALVPLLAADIVPDFVTSIDYLDLNFEKLVPFIQQQWPFSLVCTPKVTPLILKRFSAERYFIAHQKDRPQEWLNDVLGIKTMVPASFSVAHLSLGLAILMGADPIFLVGQDLGYTNVVADHAAGTVIMKSGLPTDKEIYYVKGINGEQVATDRGLMSLQHKFTEILRDYPGRCFNSSAAGVHIEGTTVLDLKTAGRQYMADQLPVRKILAGAVGKAGTFDVKSFVILCRQTMAKIAEMKKNVRQVREIYQQALPQLIDLRKKEKPPASLDELPSPLLRMMAEFDRLNNVNDAEDDFWEQVLELTFKSLSDNDRLQAANEKIRREQGYIAWLSAELSRIDMVNGEREAALYTYGDMLDKLVTHLDREGQLLATGATQPRDLLNLIRLYIKQGDLCLARKVIDTLPEKNRRSVEVLLLEADIQAGLLDFVRAENLWQQAMRQDMGCVSLVADARRRHAETWIRQADLHGNIEGDGDNFPHLLPLWFKRIMLLLGENPELPDSLLALWQKQRARVEMWIPGDMRRIAGELLQGWETVAPLIPEVYYWQSRCAMADGDLEKAVQVLAKALLYDQQNSDWLLLMARLLFKKADFDEGVAFLRQAVLIDANAAVLWEELGDILVVSSDYANAILAYEYCFASLPDRVGVLVKMGDAYAKNQQISAATAAYEAACEKDANNKEARQRLECFQENQ